MQDNHHMQEKAKEVINRHRGEFKKKYLVDQSGVGYKIQNGKSTDNVAIIFYVKRKKSKEELISEGIHPIPAEIEGVPTDVVAIPRGFRPRQSGNNV